MKIKDHSEVDSAASGRFFYNQKQQEYRPNIEQLPESMAVFDIEYADLLIPGEHHIIHQDLNERVDPMVSRTLVYGENGKGASSWQLVEAKFGRGRQITGLQVCRDGLLQAKQARLNSQGVGMASELDALVAVERIESVMNDKYVHESIIYRAGVMFDRRAIEEEKLRRLELESPRRFVSESMIKERRVKQAKVLAGIVFPRYSSHAVIV